MRKFLVLTGFLLLLSALGLGGWWAWPILFPQVPGGWLSTLARADAALVQDRPDLARAALATPPASASVTGWLQWEKRVKAVAEKTGDWEWAATASAAALTQFPGNSDLAAVDVWFRLRGGHPSEAAAAASKTLEGTPWQGLADQAKIEASGAGSWDSLAEALKTPGPGASAVLGPLTAASADPSLKRDALLSYLVQGDLEAASASLEGLDPEVRGRAPFDRLQGLMAYDRGDWPRAAALLRSLPHDDPESRLILADLALHLGRRDEAKVILDQTLADQPEAVPSALRLSRAALALEDREPDRALALLAFQPSTAEEGVRASLLTWEAKFQAGRTEEARLGLDAMIGADLNGDSDAALGAILTKGRLFPDWSSTPRLWSLIHRRPESSPLAERLAWSLLAVQDFEGALRVLALHQQAVGGDEAWWSTWYRALVLAAQDRLEDAEAAFDLVPEARRDSRFWAAWALVAGVQAQRTEADLRKPFLDRAEDRLTKALDLLPPGGAPPDLALRSRWLTRRGEVRVSLLPLELPAPRASLRSAAAEDFRQASDLDPANLRAPFLLRQLEAAKESS